MRIFIFISVLIISCIIALSSCSARRVGREWKTSETEDKEVKEGRLIFKQNCQRCHPNGEAGVGPPLNSLKLPGFALKARVRSRAFLLWTGRMPAFDKHEINKQELKSLIRFIHEMEKGEKKTGNGIK